MVMRTIASKVNKNPVGTIIIILIITALMFGSMQINGIEQEMDEEAFQPDIDIARADKELSEDFSAEYSTMMLIKASNSEKDLLTPEAMLELMDLITTLANDSKVNKGLEQPKLKEGNFNSVADLFAITLIQQELLSKFDELQIQQFQALEYALNNTINEIFDPGLTGEQKQKLNLGVKQYIITSMKPELKRSRTELSDTLNATLENINKDILSGIYSSLDSLEIQLLENFSTMISDQALDQEILSNILNMTIFQVSNLVGGELSTLDQPINNTITNLTYSIGKYFSLGLGVQLGILAEEYNSKLNLKMAENISTIMDIPKEDVLAMFSQASTDDDAQAQMMTALNETIKTEVQTTLLLFSADKTLENNINNTIENVIMNFSNFMGIEFNEMLNVLYGEAEEVLKNTKTLDELNNTITQQIYQMSSTLKNEINRTITGTTFAIPIINTIEDYLEDAAIFNESIETVAAFQLSLMKSGASESIKDLESMFSTDTGETEDQMIEEFTNLLATITMNDMKKTIAGGEINLDLMGTPIILDFEPMNEQSFKGFINGIMLSDDANFSQLQGGIKFLLTKDFDPEKNATKAKGTIVTVLLNASYDSDAQSDLEHRIDDICNNYEEEHTKNFEITTLGGYIIMDEILGSSMQSLSIILIIAFVLIIIILALIYRNGFDMGVSLLALVFSILWVYGSGAFLGYTFNPITTAIPVLIIGLGIDYGIHITMRYREELGYGNDIKKSINLTILSVGVALLLATVTTMVSFLSNLSSPISLLQEFGILCAIGIFGSFITMITFVPACKQLRDEYRLRKGKPLKYYQANTNNNTISSNPRQKPNYTPPKKKKPAAGVILLEKFMSSSAVAAERHPGVVVIIVLIITIGAFLGALRLETRFEMEDFLPEELEITQDFYFIRDEFAFGESIEGTGDTNILIKGDITQPQTLIDMQNTIDNANDNDYVQKQQGTDDLAASSILSVMEDYATRTDLPGVQDLKYSQDFEVNYSMYMNSTTGLPKTGSSSDNIKELYDWLFDNPDNNIVKDVSRVLYRSNSGEYTGAVIRIGVNVDPNDGGKITKLFNQFKDDVKPLKDNEDIDEVEITSGPILTYIIMSALNESQSNTLVITIIIALVLMIIVSYFRHHSIMLGVLTIIPVILCVIWIWGSMFLLGIPLNVMTITIASLTIGLGITYGIHISHRFAEDLEEKSIDEACRSTVAHTGTALFGAAATTIAGFGILVFALLPPLQQFGGITAMTILYSFLASVFILPTFLVLWARYHKKHGKLQDIINGRKK